MLNKLTKHLLAVALAFGLAFAMPTTVTAQTDTGVMAGTTDLGDDDEDGFPWGLLGLLGLAGLMGGRKREVVDRTYTSTHTTGGTTRP